MSFKRRLKRRNVDPATGVKFRKKNVQLIIVKCTRTSTGFIDRTKPVVTETISHWK